jgi:DNA-binding NtrC family response regulator
LAFLDLDSAVSTFQGGAFEYMPKAFELPRAANSFAVQRVAFGLHKHIYSARATAIKKPPEGGFFPQAEAN